MALIVNFKEWFSASKNNKLITILCIIFVVKGIFYAAYVTPLTTFTAPDDTGHISYIQYIASQRRLPIYRLTGFEERTLEAHHRYGSYGEVIDFVIGEESFDTFATEEINWIVQHPPLYYIAMAVIYSIASFFTRQFSTMILILRIANLAFGVASLIVMHKILNLLKAKDILRTCILLFFVFSAPMQYFFSTVTNDNMLVFMCIFALYYLLKYMDTRRLKHFVIFVIGTALIFGTKYNGFMVMFVYIGFFIYYSLRYNGVKETAKFGLIGVPIGLAIILPDLLFNYFTTSGAIPNDGGFVSRTVTFTPTNHRTLTHFLFRTNYLDFITRHIILKLGWDGTWIRPDLFIERAFAILTGAITAIHLIKSKKLLTTVPILLIGSITFVYFRFFLASIEYTTAISAIMACMLMLLCLTIMRAIRLDSKEEKEIHWLFITALVVTLLVYMYTHFGMFQRRGNLLATHGRYYYIAFFPFAYMLFHQLGELKTKLAKYIPLVLLVILAAIEYRAIILALQYYW